MLILCGPVTRDLSAGTPIPPANYDGYYDLSDTVTLNYISAQLKAVGITPDKFPMIFTSLVAAKPIYTIANAKGIVIPKTVSTVEGSALEPINVVASNPNKDSITTNETSSIPNSPLAVSNTLGLFANSQQIGSSIGSVSIGSGNEVVSTLTEPIQTGVKSYSTQGVSLFVYPASALGASTQAALGLADTTPVALSLPLEGSFTATDAGTDISNTAPTNVKGNPYMKICFGRGDSDCDYSYPTGIIQMPITGSVTFPSPIAVNPLTGVPTNAQYNVAIWYPEVGGGCNMPDTAFASQVKVSGNVLSWNANPGQFGALCSLYQYSPYYGTTVGVTYQLSMLVQSTTGSLMPAMVTTDTTAATGDGTLVLLPLEFVYGCLAKGTKITLAPGSKSGSKSGTTTRPIEKVGADEMVLGPKQTGLKVSSYWKGREKELMYRVATADGHQVDMTTMHPVPLANGKVKLAKDLAQGDEVLTEKGPSKIAAISRVPAKGDVFNLDLGAPQPSSAKVDMDKHSFYANGILVGDGRAQNHYTRKHKEHPSQVLARLPDSWHTDFYNAQLFTSAKQNKNKKSK